MKSLHDHDAMLPPTPKKEIHNADFSSHHLAGKNFEYTTFVDCRFQGTFFEDAELSYVTFRRCDLSGAHFATANLAHSTFHHCTFTTIHEAADFTAANLAYANFSGESLVRVQFEDAILHHANFSNANLRHVNFDSAQLTETIFDDPTLVQTSATQQMRPALSTTLKWVGFIAALTAIFIIWHLAYN